MSTGHKSRGHVHLGQREFDRAKNDPRFQALLNRGFNVSYDYDIPYLGGYSRDGATIYIDRDTPDSITRGRRFYQLRPNGLVRGIFTHEHWEKSAMLAWGWGYAESHELATHAENEFARTVLQIDPAEYEEVWQPVIKQAERKLHAQAAQLPPDLDPTPYQS